MKMRKFLKILIVALILIILALIITFITLYNIGKLNNTNSSDNIENDNATDINNEIIKEIEYVDDNPITLGLYVKDGNYKKLVKNEYYCGWDPEEVLGIFYVVYTNEEIIQGTNFNSVWKNYLNNYTNIDKYRIGYNIKFTMKSGEIIDQTILNPDHAYLMYPEIQFYLYDDINLIPGKRYYHVTSEEMNEDTICSSVKLVGDKMTPNITSSIELTAFTYDSDDDFDKTTGKYRGKSSYTIIIKRK